MEAASKQAADGSSAGLDQLRQSAETMAAKLAEVEGRLASERSETSAQLDALRGQMQKEAAEEAKRLQTIQQLNKVCGCCGGGGVGGRASLEVCVWGGASSTPQSGCCWY